MEKAKKRVRPGNIVLLAITIILAFLFIYPVLFALLSAFKSNGDILKNPVARPLRSIYRILRICSLIRILRQPFCIRFF